MSDSIFKSTAKYYARYRVPYPDEVIARLVTKCGLNGRQRLLDLGCGTGQVFLPLAPYLTSVVAVDPDSEMLEYAARETTRRAFSNVSFVHGKAEDMDTSCGTFHLVTAGASFHWMNRHSVGTTVARDLLVPGGRFAILGSASLWNGEETWHHIVRGVIQHWLGAWRRAGSGAFSAPSQPHQSVLAELGYEIEEDNFPVRHEWSLETLLGYLYSTSFASPELLADNRKRFEADLAQALYTHESSGRYAETIRFQLIVATPRSHSPQPTTTPQSDGA